MGQLSVPTTKHLGAVDSEEGSRVLCQGSAVLREACHS